MRPETTARIYCHGQGLSLERSSTHMSITRWTKCKYGILKDKSEFDDGKVGYSKILRSLTGSTASRIDAHSDDAGALRVMALGPWHY